MKAISSCALLVLLLVANWASAAGMADWRHDAPCGRQLPIKKVKAPGCERAYVGQLSGGVEISVCLPSFKDPNIQVNLQRGSELIKKWSMMVIPPVLLDGKKESDSVFPIRVYALDLNGDEKEEFLIGIMNNQGMGMGVMSWSIWAFDGSHLTEPIEATDYGVLSFPVCSKDGQHTFLLAGRWIDGWEPGRVKGLYFSACWFEPYFEDNTWFSSSDRPSIYHRYLFGFARLRGEAIYHDRPELWYRSAATHVQVGPWTCSTK
jgi:hypothetical protein